MFPAVRYLWKIQTAPSKPIRTFSENLGITSLVARCLWNRGLQNSEDATTFLNPFLRNLKDPFLLPDMGIAVDRLLQARKNNEPITIFGDYDVDGITSVTLLTEFFQTLGWNLAGSFLPSRIEDGYGLTPQGIHHLLEKFPQTRLLLTVDCGSTSAAAIQEFKNKGIDVIVLDHHQLDTTDMPHPIALVNPQNATEQQKQTPLFQDLLHLCSAGLAFKLAHAILSRGRKMGASWSSRFDLRNTLDLTMLGTVADMVELTGQNRVLVYQGLLRSGVLNRIGLAELYKVCRLEKISTYEISFCIAPRLNAAGRMESPSIAMELLLTKDQSRAEFLAHMLDKLNSERRQIQAEIVANAAAQIRETFDPTKDFAIVAANDNWHFGIVGIAATQICKQFNRPSIILSGDGNLWKGSCRSVEGFDIVEALRGCDDLLTRCGGHAMAAGVELKKENLKEFRSRLNRIAKEHYELHAPSKPILNIDSEVSLWELNAPSILLLKRLEPFGVGNPRIQLVVRNLHQTCPPITFGKQENHLRLHLADNQGNNTIGIIWNYSSDPISIPSGPLDVAFEPIFPPSDISEKTPSYQRGLRIKILDINPAGSKEEETSVPYLLTK